MSAPVADLVIRGGRVVDPTSDLDAVTDVAVKDGRILAVGPGTKVISSTETEVFNSSGCIVTPGLIDCHVHVYEHCTPLGVNVDRYCLARGVTTVVDAGSAGAGTFAGLRKFIADQSHTRVLALLHIAAHGLAAAGCAEPNSGGECDSLNAVDVQKCVQCIKENADMIVGVKVRLSASVADDGRNEEEIYRRALRVAKETQLPLMTHHTGSTVPTQAADADKLSCPGSLHEGDIYTHTFHGFASSILDPGSLSIHPDVLHARERGVLFDLGHGQGSFSWTVAENCARQGFFPDIISTDLHSGNHDGPAYDLLTVMSKMLHVGMPLYDVIKSVTSTPARAVKRSDLIGLLRVAQTADVTVFRVEDCDLQMEDSQAQIRQVKQLLVPVAVWKGGKKHEITQKSCFPNASKYRELAKPWDDLVVHDLQPPNFH